MGTVSFILCISGLQLHAAFFVQILPYFADMRVIEAVVALDLRFFVDGTQILHHDTELGQLAPRFHALWGENYDGLRLQPLLQLSVSCTRRPKRPVQRSFFLLSYRTIRVEKYRSIPTKLVSFFFLFLGNLIFRILRCPNTSFRRLSMHVKRRSLLPRLRLH